MRHARAALALQIGANFETFGEVMDVVVCKDFGPLLRLAAHATALEEERRFAEGKAAKGNAGAAACVACNALYGWRWPKVAACTWDGLACLLITIPTSACAMPNPHCRPLRLLHGYVCMQPRTRRSWQMQRCR
jgi:hypothetical protein